MIPSFINRLLRTKSNGVPAASEQSFSIEVRYQTLHIGTLSRKHGVWRFLYTDAFRQQDTVAPITDFPDSNRVYESPKLWPFFAIRIPSINQPQVRAYLRNHEASEEMLLNRFGRLSAANPFVLAEA
jgi:hypothetical protein